MDKCRLCMVQEDENFISIFSIINNINIATTVASACSVMLSQNDGLPNKVCNICVQDVQRVSNFIEKVRKADAVFRNQLAIKDENAKILQLETIVIKPELLDEENCETVNTNFVQSSDKLENRSDSDDDTLSTIKSRHKFNSCKIRLTDASTNDNKISKLKKITKYKQHFEYRSLVDDEHDGTMDEKEVEMFDILTLPVGSFVCCNCRKYFDASIKLDEHIEIHKKNFIKYTDSAHCEVCKRKFNNPKALNKHRQKWNSVTKLYECRRCKSRFSSTMSRRLHAHNHPKTIEDRMKEKYGEIVCCVVGCSESFVSEKLLITHSCENHKLQKQVYKVEDIQQKPSECPVCFKRFASDKLLRKHRNRSSKPLNHQCATCGLKYRTKEVLLVHEISHAEQNPFQCDTCSKHFSSKSSLKVHQRYHSKEKQFVCTTCGAGFYQKYLLRLHEYDHGNAPLPFQCNVCEKSFKVKHSLVSHMRTHTGERPFPCRHCSMTFAGTSTRRTHEMIHTESKPFKCTFCDKTFTLKRLQVEHESKHTGIKPFKCNYCDKGFIRKQFQIDHEKTHSGIKPYQCNMCNCSYSHKTNLRRHLEAQHAV